MAERLNSEGTDLYRVEATVQNAHSGGGMNMGPHSVVKKLRARSLVDALDVFYHDYYEEELVTKAHVKPIGEDGLTKGERDLMRRSALRAKDRKKRTKSAGSRDTGVRKPRTEIDRVTKGGRRLP